MEVVVQEFNSSSSNKSKLVIHVCDFGGDPLRAYKLNDLTKERGAQTIIGMEIWQETEFVDEMANKAQVPVLSFAAPSIITPPLTLVRWPFLLRMAYSNSLQIKCLASVIASYGWCQVLVIYEDDAYSTDS